MKYILPFSDVRLTDVERVGGKNASLGQMLADVRQLSIRVPDGFAITAQAYWYVVEHNQLRQKMVDALQAIGDGTNQKKLPTHAHTLRQLFNHAQIPDDLAQEIVAAYRTLCAQYHDERCAVAVRSSATAEDLPTASFAGQQETFLHVVGERNLLEYYRRCLASLFTDRAIVYRIEQGFDHMKVALSVGVQKMIRADKASAGVAFSLDPETGFDNVVMINAAYGLGEAVVQGIVTPDEYVVHKPTLEQGFPAIVRKKRGVQDYKIVYGASLTKKVKVSESERNHWVLSDEHILELARAVCAIEKQYTALKKAYCPMDIEWAVDGHDHQLYIVQARPETIHASKQQATIKQYTLRAQAPTIIAYGQSIGTVMVSGTVRVIDTVARIEQVKKGDIIVTTMTDPDWVPVMKKAAGIITDRGGRTCHAAIVSRELGIPAIVGVQGATDTFTTGQAVTIDCSQGATGMVYDGAIAYDVTTVVLADIPRAPVPVMINSANPDAAFSHALLPVSGVGLARIEFIMSGIGIHPMALLYPERVTDKKIRAQIAERTAMYRDKKDFFVDSLAQGIATIAAAFYPKPVIVRLSDFKSNEYRNLLGGEFFEPVEENPMLGFRGACRYYDKHYEAAFALECAALRKVREQLGLTNVEIMVPFVRTVDEAKKVVALLAKHELRSGSNGLKLVMMVEIPANVVLIEHYAPLFDGFSIGSNDLTQLTLGVDRDSELLGSLFDERYPAVRAMLQLAITGARAAGKPIGICGQAPSDYPEVADFLINQGITYLSLNPDAVIPFLTKSEKK